MWIVLSINVILSLFVVYFQRKDAFSMLWWGMIVLLFPVLGIVTYLMCGDGIRYVNTKSMRLKRLEDKIYDEFIEKKSAVMTTNALPANAHPVAVLNAYQSGCHYPVSNSAVVYTDNNEYFESLVSALNNAEIKIHIEQARFSNDEIGEQIREILIDKAKSGVEVKVLYDDAHSKGTTKLFFRPLVLAGGKIYRFRKSNFYLFNNAQSFTNNRSMVIVDGSVAFCGGAEFGKNYLSRHSKIKPWLDTNCKVEGQIVDMMSIRFYRDFNFASGKYNQLILTDNTFFTEKVLPIQYVVSGTDASLDAIKNSINKTINTTKNCLDISTGALVLDSTMFDNLIISLNTGVRMNIMLPTIYRNATIKAITLKTADKLRASGAKVYFVEGYINTTTILADESVCGIGSFELNKKRFKTNLENIMYIYDSNIVKQLKTNMSIIRNTATIMDKDYLNMYSKFKRFWFNALTIIYGAY